MAEIFRPVVAVDFDGTIKNDPDFYKYGDIADDCVEVLNRLHKAGCRLILWTCRGRHINDDKSTGGLEEAIEYLKKHNIYHLFEKINENIDELPFKAWPKIFANYYLDDRAILGFPGFLVSEKIIMQDRYFKSKGIQQ